MPQKNHESREREPHLCEFLNRRARPFVMIIFIVLIFVNRKSTVKDTVKKWMSTDVKNIAENKKPAVAIARSGFFIRPRLP